MVDANGMIRKQGLLIERFAEVHNTHIAVVTEAEGKVTGALA